ncbi:hypothetical protein AB6A40_004553 [Gnathostoma spinigerum]|uniref:Uncharacterized protein n=1 Tax=Gnathostoma spinigerum TaxID=75299 RepID=A0ABD6EI60_9BILA
MKLQHLVGRVVLLTNSCTAMGKALSLRLGMAGASVMIADPDNEQLTKSAEFLKENGVEVHAASGINALKDVRERSELLKKTIETYGQVDSLILCMGNNETQGDLMMARDDDFNDMLEKYLRIPFSLCQKAAPYLEKSSNGSILFITSVAGFTPFLGLGLYSITQSAVLGMCKALNLSLAKRGVRVNSLSTGMIGGDGSGALWDNATEEEQRELSGVIPLGRIGKPTDCCGLAEFLIGDGARYISGENLIVGGGMNVRF